jgi:type I restriction enzyme S subunit
MSEVNGHNKNGLPKGWEWIQLGKLCEKISKVKSTEQAQEREFFYLDIGSVDNTNNKIIGHKTYKWKDAPSRAQQIVHKDDVLFSTVRTYLKNIALVESSFYDNQIASSGFTVLRGKKEVLDPKFLFYRTLSNVFLEPLNKLQTGSSYPAVRDKDVFSQEMPVPPYEIQQQIVSKIEELFSELDKGIEQLKTAQQQLKVYRQSVLKRAFEGKLTNENVKDGNLPDGWKTIQIEDIASVGTGATPLKGKKEYYQDGKIPWVTSGSLNEEYVTAPTEFVTERALKETNLTVYPKHTLLLAMYGEGKTRGKCSELLIEATTNQAIAAIHFTKHDVQVKPFLKYFLLKNYNDIRRLSSGGVQPNLNLGIVKRTMLPFPPLEEQNRIVEEIESRLSVADKLEEPIANSLQQAEALRQSILKKAFEGKLH